MGKLPFIRESTPPPDIEEGQILRATIKSLQAPVKGNYGEQAEFNLALADGFEAKAWISYYEEPSDKSKLGRLLVKLAEVTGQVYQTVGEGLEALKQHGFIYVKCSGFREWEDLILPKFAIVADKLPPKTDVKPAVPVHAEAAQKEPVKPTDPIAYLKTVIAEAMKPGTTYPRMKLAEFAKVDAWVEDIQIEQAINGLLEDGKIRPKFEALNLVGFTKA